MILKNKNNLRSLFTVFALMTTMLWWGANMTSAQTPAARGTLHDFTGSGRTSFVTLGLPEGGGPITWRIAANPPVTGTNPAFIRVFQYGANNLDFIVPEDYSGDAKADPTVWRNGNGTFFVAQTPIGTGGITVERAVQWGAPGDNPRGIGDYDGDGKTDYTVVRNVNNINVWFIMTSRTNTMRAIQFGSRAGLPPSNAGGFTIFPGADFNNDGVDELIFVTGIAAQTRLTYQIGDARTGAGLITRDFGAYNEDISLPPDDYTGDGRADFAAVRQTQGSPAVWYILNVFTNTLSATRFGIADPGFATPDQPVRGDFDGDRRHDIAVYRESNQTFYWINSSNGMPRGQKAPAAADDFPLGAIDNY